MKSRAHRTIETAELTNPSEQDPVSDTIKHAKDEVLDATEFATEVAVFEVSAPGRNKDVGVRPDLDGVVQGAGTCPASLDPGRHPQTPLRACQGIFTPE